VNEVLPAVEKQYPGKLRFVFRHQVQPWHPQGTLVHEAAIAVARLDPDKFAPFAKVLFERQTELVSRWRTSDNSSRCLMFVPQPTVSSTLTPTTNPANKSTTSSLSSPQPLASPPIPFSASSHVSRTAPSSTPETPSPTRSRSTSASPVKMLSMSARHVCSTG